MNTCKGCREQQTDAYLCLTCIEDLNFYLREIPVLYSELGSVRLPGSVSSPGPRSASLSRTASAAPVRLEVVDLLDRGETLSRLLEWTDTGSSVTAICDGFRQHLLSTAAEAWAGQFFHAMRGLCRDLGRVVGQPEERPVGKCAQLAAEDELCRGQLMRAADGAAYCRRCGDRPDVAAQPAWLTPREAALITGKPVETIRTWIKRGQAGFRPRWLRHDDPTAGWSDPIGPAPANKVWLPTALMLATVPQRATVNHGSRAELAPDAVVPVPPLAGTAVAPIHLPPTETDSHPPESVSPSGDKT